MALTVEFIYLAARLARQWMKERGIIVCALSVWFIYLAARWARREIVVTKTCRIIKTNGSIPFHPNSFSSFTYPAID